MVFQDRQLSSQRAARRPPDYGKSILQLSFCNSSAAFDDAAKGEACTHCSLLIHKEGQAREELSIEVEEDRRLSCDDDMRQ